MNKETFNKRHRVYLPELIEYIGQIRSKAERTETLAAYCDKGKDHDLALKELLWLMYSPNANLGLPSGAPPYKSAGVPDYPMAPRSLFHWPKMTRYFKPWSPEYVANQVKREQIFTRFLESLHDKEAELLVNAKDRNDKPYRYLTANLVKDAFPLLVSEELGKGNS